MFLSDKPNKAKPDTNSKGSSRKGTAKVTSKPQQEQDLSSGVGGLSLRLKATALAIALGTVPIIVIGATAYYFADRAIVKQITQDKQQRATQIADKVNRFTFDRYGDIQIMSSFPIFKNPKLRAITTLEEKQVALNRFLDAYLVYDSIAVFDLNGNPIVQSLGKPLSNHKDRGYFQQALKSDSPVVSAENSKSTGQFVIHFAAPIKDQVTGKTIAVVRSRMPINRLADVLKKFDNSEDEYILTDPSGKIFLASHKGDLGKDAGKFFPGFDQLKAAKKPAHWITTAQVKKEERLVGYSPIEKLPGMPELNWDTIVATDTAIAFAPQQKLFSALVLGTGLTAVLVGVIAAYIANRATRPILSATKAVEKLGQGELDTRIVVAGKDEIAQLGSNINQMAEELQSFVQIQAVEAQRAHFFTSIATSRATTPEELESVFAKALQGAREILNADRIVIYRFNSDWSGYVTVESVLPSWQSALNYKIEDACIGKQLIEAYKNGRVVPTNNVLEAGFHPEHLKLMERLQIKANLVTPVVQGEQLFGLLIAHHCQAPYVWQQSEISFLSQLAAQLGLILDRLNFVEQSKAEAERSRAIKDITVQLTQASQIQGVFDTAVQQVRQAIKSDRVVVYSFNEQWQGTVIAESVASGFPHALGAKIDDPYFADKYVEKYRQGWVQATENIYKAGLTEFHIKQLEPFAIKANLVAPILRDRQLLGLLVAHQCSGSRVWQQGEIDLFSQLATQVGLALDRVNLLEQQKAAKEFLQKRALELLMEVDPISKGDLTIHANVTEDEIGTIADSYNATILSLRRIVTQVQTAAKQVANTTTSSEDAVKELSQEALRQTEEIKVALDRIQEMSNSIRAVATSAETAEAAVQQATQTVAASEAAMNRTVEGMMTIQSTVAETSKKVQQLGESSQKISKVLNLIGRFAAQTNLLALKASIEAARAGEEGRGFAVLADEVRVLARQSAEATSEIESLIVNIQTETNEVVAAMEAGTQQVASGTQLLDETRQSLNKITDVSQQISELVQAISFATVEQSQASQAVTDTMTDVAAIASQTSNEATVVSASFKELLALAQELQTSASQFKVS